MTLVRSTGTETVDTTTSSIFDGTENVGMGFYATYLDLRNVPDATEITVVVRDNGKTVYYYQIAGSMIDSSVFTSNNYFIPFLPSNNYDVRLRVNTGTVSVPWVLYKQPQV